MNVQDDVLARISVSRPRGAFGVLCLAALGALLLLVAVWRPPQELGWQAFLMTCGGISFWGAYRMRRTASISIELTSQELRSSEGVTIVAIDQIETVSRGMFAFKPSNGFTLTLRTAEKAQWRPGLWWRIGRRVGVGGVTHAPQTKAMADILTSMVAGR